MKIMKKFILSLSLFIAVSAMISAQSPCSDGTIIINGETVDAVSFDNSSTTGIKLPFWLPENNTLAAGTRVYAISVIEFDMVSNGSNYSLEFSSSKIIDSSPQTVPAGKTWKIESLAKYANAVAIPPTTSNDGPKCAGDNLSLSASSITGASYSWTGPNGFSSTLQNPTRNNVTAADSGTYSVIATVNGCTSSAANTTAMVYSIPDSAFSYLPSSPSIGNDVTFTPAETGASYSWTFQNGTPATSTAQNPVVQWSAGGTYDVSLSVTKNGCVSMKTDTIHIPACTHGSQTFYYTGNIVTWDIPSDICLPATIEVRGAEGGMNNLNNRTPGKGAIMTGDFNLTPGQQLRIIVGQKGLQGVSNPYGAGSGGGASAVSVAGSSDPLIVAGGGGGCGGQQGTFYDGGDAPATTSGGNAYPNGPSLGGTSGNGGNGGTGHEHCGAAAGGWYSAGNSTVSQASAGSALNATAAGGNAGPYGNTGGFGGGGGSNVAGGGGGGYSGGAGGDQTTGWYEFGGGGGGSYNSGTNQSNTGGVNTGNGQVIISW